MWLQSHLQHPVLFPDSEIFSWKELQKELRNAKRRIRKMPNSWSTQNQNFWGLEVLESQVKISSKALDIRACYRYIPKITFHKHPEQNRNSCNERGCRFWKRTATLLVTLECCRCNREFSHSQEMQTTRSNREFLSMKSWSMWIWEEDITWPHGPDYQVHLEIHLSCKKELCS